MFDVETLLNLGLRYHVVPIWQVLVYIAVLVPCLLLQRVKICLFVTYLFAYYLAFLTYWGDVITTSRSLLPFMLYTFFGVATAILFLVAWFREPQAGWRLGMKPTGGSQAQ